MNEKFCLTSFFYLATHYLSLNYLINDKTFFNEIKSLSPSSYIILNSKNYGKKVLINKYWFLEDFFKVLNSTI